MVDLYQGLKDFIRVFLSEIVDLGGFRNETRWIDRKTYFENLEDPYVYLCFTFGNNPVCRYAYAVEIEPWEKALTGAMCSTTQA